MAIVNKIIHSSVVDGPGNRAAVFLQKCNFKCSYCHNPETIGQCVQCGACVEKCPAKALSLKDGKIVWDEDKCCECDTCIHVCPHMSSPRVKDYTAELVLVTLGRMTNIAKTIKRYPDFAGKIKKVVSMGGTVLATGNVSPVVEANIGGDPEAADIVVQTPWDMTMVGDNIVSYSCKEQEGSFLVGALAAYMKQDAATYGLEDNHKYGFVGALENDIINRFAAGYRAGIEYVDSDADVAIQYVGGDNPFGDTTTAKEIATTQKGKGYDIIFHAAGGSGLGVFAAAQESDFIAIGANSNQNIIDPDHIVASMLKRVDVAAYDIVKAALEGDLQVGSEKVLGLEDEGIGYTLDGSNIKVPEDVVEKLEEIKEKIITGEIQVPVEL